MDASFGQLSIDFAAADRRADIGMRRAAERAERVDPGWVEEAIARLAEFARTATHPFTIEQARAAIGGQLPTPPGLRAWGTVTKAAISRGVIVPIPGGMARAASSNGSFKTTYRAGKGAA